MWSRWGRPKSTAATRGPSPKPKPSFSCSSFKDIHRLYADDDPATPRTSAAALDLSRRLPQPKPEPENQNPPPLRHRHSAPKKVFHRVRAASSLLRTWSSRPGPNPAPRLIFPGAETRIVVYFTSLKAVRPTSEACRSVQSILSGFRSHIDERDVAMDPSLLEELQRVLGTPKEKISLPAVFVGGRYVGGAEEVRRMHESGELKRLVEALPETDPGVCESCGGFRFVPCLACNGGRKVFSGKGGFRCCTACNENGLIKCSKCYPTAVVPR